MLPRIRRPRLLLAVFGVLAPCAALSQSALTLWDSVVDHPDFSEAELLRIAQFARAEMTLFDTHLELCQQVQPESAEDFAALTTHFEEIGAPVLEFLGRYSDEQLQALGVTDDGRFQAEIDQERAMLSSEFPRLDPDWQKNTCADLRASVRHMAPKAPVTRF